VSSDQPTRDKLSRPEVDFVLRRAAELDTRGLATRERGAEGGLSVGEVVRLGEEAGLRGDAISQALAELRRGVPVELDDDDGPITRALGGSRIVVSRLVPGGVEIVRRAVDRFLREQLMTVRRHHGDRIEWERAQGIWPGLARSLDFSRRYAFSLVSRVETVIAQEDGDTAVTFNIDLGDMRRERFAHMGLRSAMAFALVGLGGVAMFPGFGVADLVALASGGVAAGGVFAVERRRYLDSRGRVALAPERFLDLLTQRQRRALPAPPTPGDPDDA
jgi:hypothetical protein